MRRITTSIAWHMTRCRIIIALCVAIVGCTANGTQSVYSSAQRPWCSIYAVNIDGEQAGTAFHVTEPDGGYILTAAHVVRSLSPNKVGIVSPCDGIGHEVTKYIPIPGLDVALLYIGNATISNGLPLRTDEAQFGTYVEIPNYSDFSKGSTNVAKRLIPSEGRLIGYNAADILITMNVLTTGGSGAPIMDSQGRVIGLLTSRVRTDNSYSGVAYGVKAKSIRDAIRVFRADHH